MIVQPVYSARIYASASTALLASTLTVAVRLFNEILAEYLHTVEGCQAGFQAVSSSREGRREGCGMSKSSGSGSGT